MAYESPRKKNSGSFVYRGDPLSTIDKEIDNRRCFAQTVYF